MNPETVTIATGLCLALTSGCVGLHEILLSPDRANYPNARRLVRMLMFAWSVVLLYRSAEIISSALAPRPVYLSLGAVLGTWVLFGVQAAMLEQVLRQWLPARLQRRIQQLILIASCRHQRELRDARRSAMAAVGVPTRAPPSERVVGPALAELTLKGATVWGPGEKSGAPDPSVH